MDDPAEDVPTDDLSADRGGRARDRLFELQAAVGSSPL